MSSSSRPANSVPGGWRIMFPALVIWGSAAVLIAAPGVARFALVGMLSLSTFGLLLYLCAPAGRPILRGVLRFAGVAAACLLILLTRVDAQEHVRDAPSLTRAATTGEEVTVAVTATGFPGQVGDRLDSRFWVTAEVLLAHGTVPTVLWVDDLPGRVVPGSVLVVSGTVRQLEPSNRSAFSLNVSEVAPRASNGFVARWGDRVVGPLREGITHASARVAGAELVPGFAVGDTMLIGEELRRVMSQSSLTHLVAVSGANCALMISAGMFLAAWAGAGRRVRLVVAGVMLAGFVTVVGPDASVQRAAIMATVTLVSEFGGKRRRSTPALAVAMVVMLLMDPWQARQPGFVLSVAATAGILWFSPGIRSFLQRRLGTPALVALPLSVTVAAQLSCSPMLLFLEPGLPVGGIIANLIAVPVAPFGTGIGLLAMLILPLHSATGIALVRLASWASRWVIATGEVVAGLPLTRWFWPEGMYGAALLVVSFGLIWTASALRRGVIGLPGTTWTAARPPWQDPLPPPRSIRLLSSALGGCGLGIFVAIAVASPVTEWALTPRDWVFVACDVGQGDALLIRTQSQDRRAVLIDTGDDIELLAECLQRFQVDRIELLILTHDDADHVGALASIVDRVDDAIIARPVTGGQATRDVAQKLSRAGVRTRVGVRGDSGSFGDGGRWEILYPGETQTLLDTNATSLITRFHVAGYRFLLLGDSGAEEHQRLLMSHHDVRADVVKIAHHGSGDQDPQLLRASAARIGVISVGENNRYGHPHPDTLASMREAGLSPLRTDEHGSIALIPERGTLRVWSERGGRSEDGRGRSARGNSPYRHSRFTG